MSGKKEFEHRLAVVVKDQPTRLGYINMRVSDKIKRQIQKKADKYTDGNLSEWLMIAGLDHKPWG